MSVARKPLEQVATLQRGFDLPVQLRKPGDVPIFAANGTVGTHSIGKCEGPGVITGRSGSIGRVHFSDGPYWPLNTSLFVKDFHGNEPRYVYWLLRSIRLERYHEGTGVPTLNRNVVHKVPVPCPSLPEQRRIATILDKVDALRVKRREAIAKLDELQQSAFLDMFGDPVSNPFAWKVDVVGNHASKIGSGATPRGGQSAYKEEGISLVRSMNVRDGSFLRKDLARIDGEQAVKLKNVAVEANDVLLNITGASVARVCRAPKDVLPARVNQHVAIIRCKQTLSPVYLERLLLNMKPMLLGVAGGGATREAITKQQIESFQIPVPPIELQRRFAQMTARIETHTHTQKLSAEIWGKLFASLQHRAFSGTL